MITVHPNKKAPAKISNEDLKVGSIYKFNYSSIPGSPAYYIGMVVTVEINTKSMLVLDVVGTSDVIGNVFKISADTHSSHELFDGTITLENE